MKMKILTVKGNGAFTAGPKLPSDIIETLKEEYSAENVFLEPSKNIFEKINYRWKILSTVLNARFKKEILLFQFPMYETTTILNLFFLFCLSVMDKERCMVILHDLDSMRMDGDTETLKKQEIARLKKFKYIISHNKKMTKHIKSWGIKGKIYNVETFDYLCDKKDYAVKNNKIDVNNITIAYSGNLTKEKSNYLYQLDEDKINFKLNIYGAGFEREACTKIQYQGKCMPNELPDKLNGDLGLVWDGNVDESDEAVGYKNYTMYNNPHKLACYMAAGVPIIVWAKSAAADFVKKYNVGYTINSVYDINNIDFRDYAEKQKNVVELQKKVRSGYFVKTAVSKILKDMKK